MRVLHGVPADGTDYGRVYDAVVETKVQWDRSCEVRPTCESNPKGLPDPVIQVGAVRFLFNRDGQLTSVKLGKHKLVQIGEQPITFDMVRVSER